MYQKVQNENVLLMNRPRNKSALERKKSSVMGGVWSCFVDFIVYIAARLPEITQLSPNY